MSDVIPSLSEIFERALASDRASIHVGMPGEIVSYDAATQTATVKPCLRNVVFTEEGEQVEEELPPIQNVPVSFPSCAGFSIHFELAPGDTGDLTFSSQSHNEWQATGRVSTPGDLKRHGLGSAKFYPGLKSRKNAAPDTDNSIGVPGGLRFHFESGAISTGDGAAFVALATLADARFTAIETFLATHVHGGVTTGPGVSAVAPGAPSGSSVAASNLKADP